MRVLVTGAAGFIGSQLAEALAVSHDVVGIDAMTDYYDVDTKRANARQLWRGPGWRSSRLTCAMPT